MNPLDTVKRLAGFSDPGEIKVPDVGDGQGIPLHRIAASSTYRPHFLGERPPESNGVIGGYFNDVDQPVAWGQGPEIYGVAWNWHAVTSDRERALGLAAKLRPKFRGIVRLIRHTWDMPDAREMSGRWAVLIGPRKGQGDPSPSESP